MLNFRVLSGLLILPMAFTFGTVEHPPVASAAGYGDSDAIHRQMGVTGKNGYRPMTSRAYQHTARFHAHALNSYGTDVEQVPVETGPRASDADSNERCGD